jgi:K+-transporting ATPase ATPase C chain
MRNHAITALKMILVVIVVLGIAFPLAVTGLAQMLFPVQANGSLVMVGGKPVGSRLIGQDFTQAKYFHPRPSAAGSGYDPNSSSASNLAPTSKTYIESVAARVATATLENPGLTAGDVPVDMVTASASGLDPDISVANALAQVARVAEARGMSPDAVRQLVDAHTTPRFLGLIGEPRVNVLELNLALDRLTAGQVRP